MTTSPIKMSHQILRRPRDENLADLKKNTITLIKTIFKNSIKFKSIKNYVLKCQFFIHFLMYQKLLISSKKF